MTTVWVIGVCLLAFLTLWSFIVAAANATSAVEWVIIFVLFTMIVMLLAYTVTGGA